MVQTWDILSFGAFTAISASCLLYRKRKALSHVPPPPSTPPSTHEIKALLSTQLHPSIMQSPAPQSIHALQSLEASIQEQVPSRNEWRSNVFLPTHLPSTPLTFRKPSALAPHLSPATCRGVDLVCDNDVAQIQRVGARIVCKAWALLEDRITLLLAAILQEQPNLFGRLKIGADITIRRTTQEEHATAAPYEKHTPSAVHSDSHDGTILGFGLISTKLGTPSYPNALFPFPIKMFMSQSKTGRNSAHQLAVDTLGTLREWTPGTMVVMPACTAHSKPSLIQIQNDPTPHVPRWFCRVTMRLVIPDLWKKHGGRTRAAREERLNLSVLVAKYIWKDVAFARAVHILSRIPKLIKQMADKERNQIKEEEKTKRVSRKEQKRLAALDRGVYDGAFKTDGVNTRVRHGQGCCVYQDGRVYKGAWKNDQKNGTGTMEWKTSGGRWTGEWKNDQKNGAGMFYFKNGRSYEGDFLNDVPVDQTAFDVARNGNRDSSR